MEPWNSTEAPAPPLSNCTADTSYRFTFYQVSYSVIFLLGLATNGLALHRLWRSPRAALTCSAVYMANLSAADVFFVASLPLRVYYYHQEARAAASASGPPGAVLCQLTFALKYVSLYGGIFFLVCIAVDRYVAVVRPLAPRRLRTAQLVSGSIWCLVLGLSVGLPLLHSASATRRPCPLDPALRLHRGLILTALGLVLAAFALPAALLLFSYGGVLRALRRPRPCSAAAPRRHRQRRHRRTLTVIYWVLAVFLLCFAPYHLNLLGYTLTHLGLLRSCSLARLTRALHPVVLALASFNCCLNPLLYYFSSSLANREGAGSGGGGSGSQ